MLCEAFFMLEASNETMLFLETMTSCCVMSYLYLRPVFNIYKNRLCILSTYFWFASQQKQSFSNK